MLFEREGARVALVDQVAKWAEQTQQMIAGKQREGFVIEADVTRTADCPRVVQTVVGRYGPTHILRSNVGIGGSGSVVVVDEAR